MLQTMKLLKRMSRKMGDGADSDGSEDSAHLRGGEPDFAGISNLRRRYRNHPEQFGPAYTDRAASDLGARDPRQVWRFTDNGKRMRVKFGKMVSIFQVLVCVLEIVHCPPKRGAYKGQRLGSQAREGDPSSCGGQGELGESCSPDSGGQKSYIIPAGSRRSAKNQHI